MSISDKFRTKDLIIVGVVLALFAIAFIVVLNIYKREGEQRSAVISDSGERDPDHVEVFVKLLSVDPIKGDAVARLEFVPHGALVKGEDDDILTRDLKLYTNGATGKRELDFQKGKRMNPSEVVIEMYDGLATDYPFDQHSAMLEVYFTSKEKAKPAQGAEDKPAAATSPQGESAAPTPSESPAPSPATSDGAQAAPKKDESAADDNGEESVAVAVDFYGSIPGFKINAAKNPESTEDYVALDMKISRSSTVVFFSMFITVLMWGVTIAVLVLTLSVLLRGRKIEIGMFSFLAALLFAFAAVRNSQPGVPPIGTYSDFIAFFWAEVIIALCLLSIIFTWLLRPTAK
ncbi:MAG TPA: DUF4436 family protein [Pyrinomonadaceae bacterium]|jgi:hypothetical protein|nr:DUF4436 family protein [Pyrinomonadaceae bacterium]